MAKIKVDLTGEQGDKAFDGVIADPPPVGVYIAEVDECNFGYSKDRDTGGEDKSRPRLEVIYRLLQMGDGSDLPQAYGKVWDYVSFGEASKWKQDQFFQTVGLVNAKNKRSFEFDTEAHPRKIAGTKCKVRVVADKDLNGEYRARIGATFPMEDGASDAAADELGADEAFADELEEELTEEYIRGLKAAELKDLAAEHDVDIKGLKVAQVKDKLVTELLGEGEELEDDDEFLEDDEELEEDEDEAPTDEEIDAMDPADLKAFAKEHGIDMAGVKKVSEARQRVKAHFADDEGEIDPDDVPF